MSQIPCLRFHVSDSMSQNIIGIHVSESTYRTKFDRVLGSRRGFLQSIDHPSNKPPPGWGAVRPGQCAYRIVEGINYSAGNSAGPAQCLRFRHDSFYGSRTNSLAGNIATHQAALPWNTPGSIGLGWPQKPHGPAAWACKPDRNEADCLRHLRSSPGEKNTPPYHGISIYIL